MSRLLHRGLLSALVMSIGLVVAPAPAQAALPTAALPKAALPTAAVAMGDSFVSGEGAGMYQKVTDTAGVAQDFPGMAADNSNAYFCHRSARASLHQASLPGIQARFNLACSGGQPHDIANPSSARPNGRTVDSQLAQLRTVAKTHDIDVVLIGLGSNNSHYTFGKIASTCIERFIADAWIAKLEFWFGKKRHPQEPCKKEELITDATANAAHIETGDALHQILKTLREVDADGKHRIVLQDYINPLPEELHSRYHEEDNRSDTREKFRALGAERYAAGCPVHRASLLPGDYVANVLGFSASQNALRMRQEFPGADVVYLNVRRAFDGARLCENDNSPTGTLVTPMRMQAYIDGTQVADIGGWNKIDIQRATKLCKEYYHTCQESWHPNADGHAVLGRCLNGAVTSTGKQSVVCQRRPDGSLTIS
jgi:lysophospholipase L1-like esterase